MESESRLFLSHYQPSHSLITHMHQIWPNMPLLVYPGSEQPAAVVVQCKRQVWVQCWQNENDLHIKCPPGWHSTSTWFKFLVPLADTEAKPLSHQKRMQLNRLLCCYLKMHFYGNLPTRNISPLIPYLLSKFQVSILHNFSFHGLIKTLLCWLSSQHYVLN
jgi:hypothetical protein